MSEIAPVEYGPLKELVGVWKGNKGIDIAPESDGTEETAMLDIYGRVFEHTDENELVRE